MLKIANEISVSVSVSFLNPLLTTQSVGRGVSGYLANSLLGVGPSAGSLSTSNSAKTAIPLGSIATPYFCWFRNMDTVNSITIYNGNAGGTTTKIATLNPGDPALIPLDSGCVPYAQNNSATTATAELEYQILSA